MNKAELIGKFVASKKLAFAGLSRDPKSFSRMVFKDMKEKGFEVFAINPNAEMIDNSKCFRSVEEIPDEVENLIIMTAKDKSDDVLKTAINKGFKYIWVQQGVNTNNTESIAKEMNFSNLITKQCIFMFNNPSGMHKLHRTINKFFGLLPK